jgi:ArsR family transcriptional regulator
MAIGIVLSPPQLWAPGDMLDILLGIWQNVNMPIQAAFRALANDRRLLILEWLKKPREHFPPQVDGDLVKDGVCGVFIAEKLGVSQPTASEHLRILAQAGLLRGKRIKQWTFYKRDETRIAEIKNAIVKKI